METLFVILFIFLAFTSWFWPIMFVTSLLDAIKRIHQGEEYETQRIRCCISLAAIAIGPFVISLLLT